jgi:hypothetical protein
MFLLFHKKAKSKPKEHYQMNPAFALNGSRSRSYESITAVS